MSATPVSLLDRLRDDANEQSWRQFVNLYSPLLQRWLNRYAVQPQDADDLIQETLQTVLEELPRFRHSRRSGAFRHWLRQVLIHRLGAHWRQRDYQPAPATALELQQLEDPSSGPSHLWDVEHDRHVIRRLLEAVRHEFQPGTWQAFEAVMLRGQAPAEAATGLDMSVNAVLLAKSRILRRLREEARDLLP
jgi:RNA polymerase sigma-70 factor (ECF subfamily)